jgi:hypothetical protein
MSAPSLYGGKQSTRSENRKRKRNKGRSESGSFLKLPHYILRSNEFGNLRPWAAKLLIELAKEYKGYNNGDFSAAYSVLKQRGWNSPGTLSSALKELQADGWILLTRQGGKNRCSLYAITWWSIDGCNGKHDYHEENIALNTWKKLQSISVST